MSIRQITILAGGWSATRVDLRKLPGTVIAVNDAAYYSPRWDICVSMDRLWTEQRWKLIEHNDVKLIWLRRSTLKNVSFDHCAHVKAFDNDHTATRLSDEPGRLDGTHSGFCALNLAYQMRPRELYLVGFDMQLGPHGERHWYPDYPWNPKASSAGKLDEWARQFDTAAEQLKAAEIAVWLCGRSSKLTRWPWIDPKSLQGVACAA